MGTSRWTLASAAAFVAVLASAAGTPVHAQGVTTGAISGTVRDESGRGLENAQVQVINRATGYSTGVMTRPGGRFLVQGLAPGGPYVVNVRLLGYVPASRDSLTVALGQNVPIEFTLIAQAVTLEAVTVRAETEQILSPNKMGTGTAFSEQTIERLPSINRNFTDFLNLTPQVARPGFGGLSGGGVNHRLNNIQIDGASENDLFGLGATGQPGGQARGKSIPLDAVKEYQVLLSPYDVRHGNFAGLLVNAVTKSGTNDFRVTAFGDARDNSLAQQSNFMKASEYEQRRYGFSVGGPIVRDRLHFFVAPEWQQRNEPAVGPFIGMSEPPPGQPGVRVPVTQADIDEFNQVLASYGLPSNGSGARVTKDNPLTNLFGRLDFSLPELRSRVVLRHNYGRAEDDIFGRSTASNNPAFALTNNGYFFESTKNGTVAQLHTQWAGGAQNEFIFGYNTIRDRRTPLVVSPTVSVRIPPREEFGGTATLIAGAEQFSQGNELDQDITELTNNFTFPWSGMNVTIGTKNEFYKIRNMFLESSYGVWGFDSMDSLRNGEAATYRLAQPLNPDLGIDGVIARVKARQHSLYAQTEWRPRPQLNVQLGLRADVPIFDNRPTYAPVVEEVFGRRTDEIPSGNIQWSPRFGFNWDIDGDRSQQLRGGVGMYVGRPAFVWVANSWQNNGAGLGILNCSTSGATPGRAPDFVADVNNQPNYCIHRTTGEQVGLATGVVGPVNLMDKSLKWPQTLRGSLAYDRRIFGGAIMTVEGLYTRGINQFFVINRNLGQPKGLDRHGRVVYGTIAASGIASASVKDSRFSEVIDIENQSRDYSWQLTGQLQHRFSERLEARGAYTHSRVRDVQSLTSSRAISNWRFGRVLATDHLYANRTVSLFDQPHKITFSGTYSLPWSRFRTDFSLGYFGQSGNPFAYVYGGSGGRGDMNADGQQGNDPIYIPRNAHVETEIIFAPVTINRGGGVIDTVTTAFAQAEAFERFINGAECLRKQRGQIMAPNSCRNPWQNYVTMSVRQSLPSISGHNLAFQLDVFNLLNLLNKEWGLQRSATGFNNANLLTHISQTAGPLGVSQGRFQFNPVTERWNSDNLESNYQLQLSLRYTF